MSSESVTSFEYYQEKWNPIFQPLLYKMINGLTTQIVHFQYLAYSIYNRFQKLCYNYEPGMDNNKRKRNSPSLQKCFCRVSLLTAGNELVTGFANMNNSDNDQFDQLFHEIA